MAQYTYQDSKNMMDNNGTAAGPKTDGTLCYMPAMTCLKSYAIGTNWYQAAALGTIGDQIGCDPTGIDERKRLFRIATAPGAGKTWTIGRVIIRAGVTTTFDTLTIADAATSCEFTTNMHLQDGDIFLLSAQATTGTPAGTGLCWTTAKRRGNGQVIMGSWGGSLTLTKGQDRILALPGGGQQAAGSYGELRPFINADVGYLTISSNVPILGADTLDVWVVTVPASGGTYDSANFSQTAVHVQLTGGASSGSYTGSLVTFARQDLIALEGKFTDNGGGSTSPAHVFAGFQAFSIAGNDCWHSGEGFPLSATKTGYFWSAMDPVINVSETLCFGRFYAADITGLMVAARATGTALDDVATGGTAIIDIRQNQGIPLNPQTLTITGASGAHTQAGGNFAAALLSIVDGDTIGFKYTLTSMGSSLPGVSSAIISRTADDPPPATGPTYPQIERLNVPTRGVLRGVVA